MITFLLCFLGLTVSSICGLEDQLTQATVDQPRPYVQESLTEEDQALLASLTFGCNGKARGYYRDTGSDCHVFHYCDGSSRRYSYKCKDGKTFDKETLSCIYSTGDECSTKSRNGVKNMEQQIKESAENNNNINRGKLIFAAKDVEFDHQAAAKGGLTTLSAFAALAENADSKFASSDRIESIYRPNSPPFKASDLITIRSQSSHPYIYYDLPTSPHASIYNKMTKDDIYTDQTVRSPLETDSSINQRFYDNYQPYTSSLPSRSINIISDNTPRSFYHPTGFGRNNFDYYPTVTEPYKNTNNIYRNSQHQVPNIKNTGKLGHNSHFSHFNFSPPSPELSIKHINDKKTINNFSGPYTNKQFPTISSPLLRNPNLGEYRQNSKPSTLQRRKPPSIFGAPSFKSNPVPNININKPNSGHKVYNDEIYTTPFDNVNHNSPYHFPVGYPHSSLQPNSQLYSNSPISYSTFSGPETVPHISHQAGIHNPSGVLTHNLYQPINLNVPHKPNRQIINSPIRPTITNTELSIAYPQKVWGKQTQPFINENPNIYVTTKSPKHAISNHKKVLQDDDLPIINDEEYYHNPLLTEFGVETTPSTLVKEKNAFDEKVEKNINENLEITTYSPSIEYKVKEKQITTRPLRRKTLRTRIRPSSRKNETPKQESVQHHKKKIKEEVTENPIVHKISTEKETTTKISSTTVQPIIRKSPKSSPSLRGSLKERLNRLNSRRRRPSSRVTSGNANNRSVVRKQSSTAPTRRRKKIGQSVEPTPQVIKVIEDQRPTEKKISPKNNKRLKSRVSTFFKERSQGRNRQRTVRRRLTKGDSSVIKTDNEDTEDKISKESNIEVEQKEVVETVSKVAEVEVVNKKENKRNEATKGVKRKLPMNPNVRARFKQFLKGRKNNRLNIKGKPKNKSEITEEVTSLDETDEEQMKDVDKKVDLEETQESENDNAGEESIIMRKSVPLVREQKVILLNDFQNPVDVRQKRLSDSDTSSKPTSNHVDKQLSAKPFRYTINKTEKVHKKKEAQIKVSTKEMKEVTTVKSLADRILDNKRTRSNTPQTTKHTVVHPSNFKQIVRMHPRNPYELMAMPSIVSGSTSSKMLSTLSTLPVSEEIKEADVLSLPTTENEVLFGYQVSPTEDLTEHQLDPTPLKAVSSVAKQMFSELDKNNEVADFKKDSILTNVARPVFNLDSVVESLNTNSKEEHISALDNSGYSDTLSSVKFQPFALLNEEPLLPIQRLLQI